MQKWLIEPRLEKIQCKFSFRNSECYGLERLDGPLEITLTDFIM